MGSEGPPSKDFKDGGYRTVIHVTGFKKFHGVAENPTETIVSKLPEYVEKRGGLPNGALLGSCTVIETAGQGARPALYSLFTNSLPAINESDSAIVGMNYSDSAIVDNPSIDNPITSSNTPERVVWLHFGVNSGANKFAIENQAVNEATFRCPDEMGWQPQRIPIFKEDGNILHIRQTTLPAKEIAQALSKQGHDVVVSDDAGRFVCNYVYYHSLRFAASNNTKSLFVHVPLFSKISEEAQMQFVASLLEEIATIE